MGKVNNVKRWNELFSNEHLNEHFQERVKEKVSVGLDRVTVSKFEKNIEQEIDIIQRKVKNGTYHFTRYRQVLFSKGAGKEPRIISVPTVRDKLVASTLNELLSEIYGEQSKSPLPQKVIASIQNALPFYDCFIKIDVSRFYSSINHKILMRIIRRKIRKKEIISLIEKSITTETVSLPIKHPGENGKRDQGVPEGLPISNALANIYLSDVDEKYGKDKGIKYYRYVDDILILVDKTDFNRVKKSIMADMKKLKLEINDNKIDFGETAYPFSYLGYSICRSFTSVGKSSVYRLEKSIEELMQKSKRYNHKYIEWKLNLKITGFILDDNKYGWMFFYSQISDTSILHHLDWYVNKMLVRYSLDEGIKVKKYVRVFFEITKKLHETKYIPNISNFTIDEKKRILSEIYSEKIENLEDSKVEYLFRKIMRREIQDIERDVEHFS